MSVWLALFVPPASYCSSWTTREITRWLDTGSLFDEWNWVPSQHAKPSSDGHPVMAMACIGSSMCRGLQVACLISVILPQPFCGTWPPTPLDIFQGTVHGAANPETRQAIPYLAGRLVGLYGGAWFWLRGVRDPASARYHQRHAKQVVHNHYREALLQ